MALADPQSIDIGAGAVSLPRVDSGVGTSRYASADGTHVLTLANAYGRRTRRVMRFDHSKITTDPFIPADNVKVSASHYLVFDLPPAGYSVSDMLGIFGGLLTVATASSNLVTTKLLGGQS